MSRFGDLISGKNAAISAAPEESAAPSEPSESIVQPPAEEKVIDLNKRRRKRKSK